MFVEWNYIIVLKNIKNENVKICSSIFFIALFYEL